MSHVTKYYISEVLEEVCQRLGGISEHVFPEHRPAAAGKQMDDSSWFPSLYPLKTKTPTRKPPCA